MTTLRQAAELALEAMKDFDYDKRLAAIESLEKALAEPECKTHPNAPHGFCRNASASKDRYVCECKYWNPPQSKWVGLTYDEINECFKQMGRGLDKYATFARAIEAKLRKKNR